MRIMFGGMRLFQIILSKLPCTHHVKRELKLTNADKNRGDIEGYETVKEMQCHVIFYVHGLVQCLSLFIMR